MVHVVAAIVISLLGVVWLCNACSEFTVALEYANRAEFVCGWLSDCVACQCFVLAQIFVGLVVA